VCVFFFIDGAGFLRSSDRVVYDRMDLGFILAENNENRVWRYLVMDVA
jgi:hypothetical protein